MILEKQFMISEMAEDNILPFKGTLKKESSKIQASHTRDGPICETTLAENFAIKKFLHYALEDVKYQTDKIRESTISKKKLEENLFMSGFLSEYLGILLEEIELAIKSVNP